jgi:DNA-directed RNA polymerase subunit beta
METAPDARENFGLQAALKSIFPLKDSTDLLELIFFSYVLDPPINDLTECLTKDLTFEAPMRIALAVKLHERDKYTWEKRFRDLKREELDFETIPLMTERGTFVVNGVELVCLNQLPGPIFFGPNQGPTIGAAKQPKTFKTNGQWPGAGASLGNRWVQDVGYLFASQYKVGLENLKTEIIRRLSGRDPEALWPRDLINPKLVAKALKEFFEDRQLFQPLIKNQPLAAINQHRRLWVQEPGDPPVRADSEGSTAPCGDLYGRVNLLDQPLGPDKGPIAYLAACAQINNSGFIANPFRQVQNGAMAQPINYLAPNEETNQKVALATAKINQKAHLTQQIVAGQVNGKRTDIPVKEVSLIEATSFQTLALNPALTPFLNLDNYSQAINRSEILNQAVPLWRAETPLIETGLEAAVAQDSGLVAVATHEGIVVEANASRVVTKTLKNVRVIKDNAFRVYEINEGQRPNLGRCHSQRPIVKPLDKVRVGQALADGPMTERGELALGQNVTVAYMRLGGSNKNDSIIVSERLIKEDLFTSIHLTVFEIDARETKYGPEEITNDLPHLKKAALAHLDSSGIARVGAEVKAGDILVGRLTPEGQTQPTKKDTSFRVPFGVEGLVIDVQALFRDKLSKDSFERRLELEKARDELIAQRQSATAKCQKALAETLKGQTLLHSVRDPRNKSIAIAKNQVLNKRMIKALSPSVWSGVKFKESQNKNISAKVNDILTRYQEAVKNSRRLYDLKAAKIQGGDETPSGVMTRIKVFVATKQKLAVGDVLANRHGDQGEVTKILPEEDMPILPDGSPLDVVLNAALIPGLLNQGQIMEAQLGWVSQVIGQNIGQLVDEGDPDKLVDYLHIILNERDFIRCCAGLSGDAISRMANLSRKGLHIVTPPIGGATNGDIAYFQKIANIPSGGQIELRDGRTGQRFKRHAPVGVTHLFKLDRKAVEK